MEYGWQMEYGSSAYLLAKDLSPYSNVQRGILKITFAP